MKHFLTRLRHFCVSMFPFVVTVLILANFIVAFFVYRSSHPRYMYRTFEITNVVYTVTTAYVATVSSSLPDSASTNNVSKPQAPTPNSYPKPYEYFVLSSLRMARIDGITYTEGDVCSRGLILRIFPDRIYLHNGDVIENNAPSRSQSLHKTELSKHDRRTVH